MTLPRLTAFEQLLGSLWPFPEPPTQMKKFCSWYESIIDCLQDISLEEKIKLKDQSIESWININLHGGFQVKKF